VRVRALATLMAATVLLAFALPDIAATTAWAGAQRARAIAAPAAPAVVLINQPAGSLCSGHRFKVGVWYQSFSGGSRAYRISIWGPRHIRFFYRHGLASAKHWRFWKVKAGRRGRYRIVYAGHRPGSKKWTKFPIIIHARRCSRR
jgi:hypothetical protein